ncbi:MAG: hypothetical protein AAB518_00520 [Patescibacteria group bacterium]
MAKRKTGKTSATHRVRERKKLDLRMVAFLLSIREVLRDDPELQRECEVIIKGVAAKTELPKK